MKTSKEEGKPSSLFLKTILGYKLPFILYDKGVKRTGRAYL